MNGLISEDYNMTNVPNCDICAGLVVCSIMSVDVCLLPWPHCSPQEGTVLGSWVSPCTPSYIVVNLAISPAYPVL